MGHKEYIFEGVAMEGDAPVQVTREDMENAEAKVENMVNRGVQFDKDAILRQYQNMSVTQLQAILSAFKSGLGASMTQKSEDIMKVESYICKLIQQKQQQGNRMNNRQQQFRNPNAGYRQGMGSYRNSGVNNMAMRRR